MGSKWVEAEAVASLAPKKASFGSIATTAGRVGGSLPAFGENEGKSLERRKFDWKDLKFIVRVIRRGLRAQDEEWTNSWKEHSAQKQLPGLEDFQPPPQELDGKPNRNYKVYTNALTEMVERNLLVLSQKDWAKDLIFKKQGESDEVPPPSEEEEDEGPQEVNLVAPEQEAVAKDGN